MSHRAKSMIFAVALSLALAIIFTAMLVSTTGWEIPGLAPSIP